MFCKVTERSHAHFVSFLLHVKYTLSYCIVSYRIEFGVLSKFTVMQRSSLFSRFFLFYFMLT